MLEIVAGYRGQLQQAPKLLTDDKAVQTARVPALTFIPRQKNRRQSLILNCVLDGGAYGSLPTWLPPVETLLILRLGDKYPLRV
jgi:hypothetical protein